MPRPNIRATVEIEIVDPDASPHMVTHEGVTFPYGVDEATHDRVGEAVHGIIDAGDYEGYIYTVVVGDVKWIGAGS